MTKKRDAPPGGGTSPPASHSPDSRSGDQPAGRLADTNILLLGDICFDIGWYPEPDRYSSAFGLRRHDDQRQVVERALRGFVDRYVLPPWSLERLSDEIYGLWRDHEIEKRLADRERRFNDHFRRSARAYFQKKLKEMDDDTMLHAARMVRIATLRRRGRSLEDAVQGALTVTYGDLTQSEKRAARDRITNTTITGRRDRVPSERVLFLKRVAAVLERETGHPIRFSSYTDSRRRPKGASGRHYGPEFAVMQAAAAIAGHDGGNESLAMHIRRIRRP